MPNLFQCWCWQDRRVYHTEYNTGTNALWRSSRYVPDSENVAHSKTCHGTNWGKILWRIPVNFKLKDYLKPFLFATASFFNITFTQYFLCCRTSINSAIEQRSNTSDHSTTMQTEVMSNELCKLMSSCINQHNRLNIHNSGTIFLIRYKENNGIAINHLLMGCTSWNIESIGYYDNLQILISHSVLWLLGNWLM